jgi:hypothetical protein
LTVPSTIQKIISYALAAIAMGGLAIYGAMLMTMSLSFRSTKPGGVWVADRSAAYPTAAVASEPVSTT